MNRKQEWFDKMLRGLAAQDWVRAVSTLSGACVYRDGTRKCAIGHIIDDVAAVRCGSSGIARLIQVQCLKDLGLGDISESETVFLIYAQYAHDAAWDKVSMQAKFRGVARDHGLAWPEDVK